MFLNSGRWKRPVLRVMASYARHNGVTETGTNLTPYSKLRGE